MENIEDMIISICEDLGAKIPSLDGDDDIKAMSLQADLKLDTIDLLELMFCLQDAFGVSLDETDFDECETIEDLCDYIASIDR